jgi:uncharacterized DUF497 family protein
MFIKRGAKKLLGGEMQGEEPNWEPLLELAPEEIDDFMWMFEVELEDGAMVQAYKHWWTRRYIHLDFAGRAFIFTEDNQYEEVDPAELLVAVLDRRESRASILEQDPVDCSKLECAPSAERHGVSPTDSAYVIEHAGLCFEQEERYEQFEPRLFFFGKDSAGKGLEVVAIELRDQGLRVIHAKTMERPFGPDYIEALGWPR